MYTWYNYANSPGEMITINSQLKGSLILVCTSIIWGMAFSAQSTAMRYLQPYTFVFLRSVITFLVLMAAMPLIRRFSGDGASSENSGWKAHLIPGAVIGLFLALATILQQVGLVHTTPAKSGFVTALYIVMVPLLGLFMGRRVGRMLWLGLALSLTGMVLLCVQTDLSVNIGDLFTLGSALMFSLQIIMISRCAPNMDALKLSALQFAVCAVISGVAALLFETVRLDGVMNCWPSILYVAVCSGAIGYTLQMVGQKYTDPTLAAILMCLESVFAALGGWLLLGQSLSPRELLGCALMLAASVIAQLPEKRAA